MTPATIGIIGFIVLLALIFLEMPVGIALLLVGFVGTWYISGLPVALHVIGTIPYNTSVVYLWSLVPLFVLMGEFARHTALGSDLFAGAVKWLGHFPGGLVMTAIGASTAFGAVCGVNIAAAVTMTSVCLPEMRKHKYDDGLSLGAICSGGLLSFLIPPSVAFIVYGLLANVNISALFIAGVFPGLLCAVLFIAVTYITCRINPAKGPAAPRSTPIERLLSLKYLWSVLIVSLIIWGGIYSGFITPTEAGALGAFATVIIGLIRRRLKWKGFSAALLTSVETTGMVFLLLLGAWTFASFLSLTAIPKALIGLMTGWSPGLILFFVIIFYFLGGLIFDSVILMVITIPMFLPLWMMAGFDLVWLGVILILIVGVGCNTPPVALVVYVVAGMVPDVPVSKIFWGVLLYVPAVLFCALLTIFFPQIATFLPSVMR